MRKISFINGSPRGKKSGSQYFINEISQMINKHMDVKSFCIIDCLEDGILEGVFQELLSSDDLVFTFPLYVDSIPSNMLDFLVLFDEYVKEHNHHKQVPNVYAVVNCGFLEGEQNRHALKIMEHFSNRIGFTWRFGIGLGAGEFLSRTPDIPMESKVKRNIFDALTRLIGGIEKEAEETENSLLTSPQIPRFLFIYMGSKGWLKMAKDNNLKKKHLMAKPYC